MMTLNKEFFPAIVVVAFNRPHAMYRLLKSLAGSHCENGTKLIISIDNNGENEDVVQVAKDFNWKFGEKEVIYHEQRLGLKKHIMKCGDLSYKYGSVIVLEDDLVVSHYFYRFAKEALSFYANDSNIAGISLYNLPYTESSKLPFIPLKENSDVYFQQVPSSLGQCWSLDHWDKFKKWYETDPDIIEIENLPSIAKIWWPESSWKKYYYGYLSKYRKYFVFPQISFTTNFNEEGTNMYMKSYFGQTQLKMFDSAFQFIPLDEANNVYDSYSEILPDRLNRLTGVLKDFDYELDLYGKKDNYRKEFVLTSKPASKSIMGFERSMKPHELNIIYNIPGHELQLVKREEVINKRQDIDAFVTEYSYFYTNVFTTDILMSILKNRIKKRLKSFFNK